MPGALPVLNRQVVEFAVKASQALNLQVNETSIFARKNYFYPDLPKGYQISQFDKPLAEHGYIEVTTAEGETKRIGITRLHLEEDAGKSMHEGFADSDTKTYVDLNRTGTPLAEIVSEPEISTPEEAYEYLTRLKEIILYTGVSDCNMEEGSLRCDANISIRPRGQQTARHQGRGQKRKLLPLRQAGARIRDRTPERGARIRRPDPAGDASLQPRRGPHLHHALQGKGARLPLLP